jgi:O-antigen/teichoic acid export membrane protein
MSIIAKQSVTNVIITYIGFAIGAVNTLFMYPYILGDTYYGLTGFLLSTANIVMPFMAFGVHNTMVKFYATYQTEQQKAEFLTFMLFLPLLFIIPFSILSFLFYEQIASLLSVENPIIYDYLWIIPVVGLCMGYFEIFYAWVKVHLQSVFGNFLREIFLRLLATIALIMVYYDLMTPVQFVYVLIAIYALVTLMMKLYAYKTKYPKFTFKFPERINAAFEYSLYIILSGSIAMLLLDIDKFMIAQYVKIENVAYYSVAIFISLVISVPGRAMHQIVYPITAKLMTENKMAELNGLYKKTSITLQVVGGLVYLGILVNIQQMYLLLPEQYAGGIAIVFFVGLSKYLDLVLGNNNSIIFNSKYYKAVLFLGVMLTIITIVLNMVFIPYFGINGAAFATLLSITLYSIAKLYFVVKKMDLYPFTKYNLYAFVILIVLFGAFYFWDFTFHPFINIALKTSIFVPAYIFIHYKLKISEDINSSIDTVFRLIFNRKKQN